MSVLLIAPPLSEPQMANLAIELLAGQARDLGHEAEVLHGALFQPPSFHDAMIHGIGSPGCFTPLYFGLDPVDHAEQLTESIRVDFEVRDRIFSDRWGDLVDKFLYSIGEAERCVRDILAAIPQRRFDVIGFSIGFDSQKMPAASIARALRARGEDAVFVAGGTGTDGPMGTALLEQFPEFDMVLRGEADDSWPVLLTRLAERAEPHDVPGCVFRSGTSVIEVPEAPVSDTFLRHPLVDYSSFIAQKERSPYRDRKLAVLLETSRGCWWGQKHHCTFCGIKNVDDRYRTRAAADTVASLVKLYDTYKPDLLYCTDSIAPINYITEVWPALAAARSEGRDWTIFYETKSNLRRNSIEVMAAAGVTSVQPGIESFSTSSLSLMDKGAAGLQQIAFLKWARAYKIAVTYGIITGMPGETASDLRGIARKCEKIMHLTPPADVSRLVLHRFSPHFANPAGYGLDDVRPFAVQRVIYRCPDERLMRLCYQLNFTVRDQGDEFEAARDELVAVAHRWQKRYSAGDRLSIVNAERPVIIRYTKGAGLDVATITDPIESAVLTGCTEVSSIARIAHLSETPAEAIQSAAAHLESRGLLLTERGSALTLPVP
ncbi:MAG TPA: RiPP maturation radical SAM C-methyltransferase [Streptosporangiaceae bacterium]|nr:RiPP maturation radical SAM C-methyltransferase [Streptosporangiaceae bacterium]